MATTTNYGWSTPDDVSLVKDGASAIRTLGSSVDTTTKNLNPETTLGDIAYRSSTANVKTRLGLGTAGQVLQVNSGATAPEWATFSANSMTLLSTTTLSGASTTVASISGSYEDLYINIFEMTNATALSNIALTLFNGATGITNITGYRTDTRPAPIVQDVISTLPLSAFLGNNSKINRTTASNFYNIHIKNYAASSEFKVLRVHGGYQSDDSYHNLYTIDSYIYSDTAIDKIVLSSPGGDFNGGTIQIYGVK
jgi:hypothetical protein